MSWRRKRNSRFFTRRSSWLSLTTALVSWSALSPSRWTCFSTTADGTFRIKRGECVCLLADAVSLWCVWLLYCVCFRESQAGAKLSLNRQFADERWSKHRVVTCLDWSPQVRHHACNTAFNTLSVKLSCFLSFPSVPWAAGGVIQQ